MLTQASSTKSADGKSISADGAEGSESPAPGGDLFRALLGSFQEIWGSVEGLVEIKADRIRISMRRSIVGATLGACVAVCTAVWLGAAALAVLRGARGGLAALFGGSEWMGDLTGGLLAWAIAAAAIAIHLRRSSRRELTELMAKYERIRHRHDASQGTPSPADDGRGAA